jgi:hypothetical protein
MDAVLGIDLQPRPPVRFLDKLVNARGAISLLRTVIERQIHVNGYGGIL